MLDHKPNPGHFLRAWRTHRGLSLAAAGAHLGMTGQAVGKIENGHRPYNQHVLEGLAQLYRTDQGSLVMRDPQKVDPLWSLYDRLGPREWQSLVSRVASDLEPGALPGK